MKMEKEKLEKIIENLFDGELIVDPNTAEVSIYLKPIRKNQMPCAKLLIQLSNVEIIYDDNNIIIVKCGDRFYIFFSSLI